MSVDLRSHTIRWSDRQPRSQRHARRQDENCAAEKAIADWSEIRVGLGHCHTPPRRGIPPQLFRREGLIIERITHRVGYSTHCTITGRGESRFIPVEGTQLPPAARRVKKEVYSVPPDTRIGPKLPAKGRSMPRLVVACFLLLTATLRAADPARPVHFENDIEPLLSRYNCNSSGCHGKAEGQNGFKLSVFGYDPAADRAALVKEDRGRRIFPAAPEQSLLLRKISGQVAHGGGIRIRAGTEDYLTIRKWVAAGAPFGDPNAPHVAALRIEPEEKILAMHSGQQLRVVAKFSDGRETDVTRHAKFQSNNEGLALVSANGLVNTFDSPGDVAIMASYLGQVATFRALIPLPQRTTTQQALPRFKFVDKLVDQKLAKLNIEPSQLCDDAEFLRRVYLDTIGTLPTAAEARRFLTDMSKEKRANLVDDLLKRSEFSDYWALKWADLLRVDRQALGHQRAYAYYKWIRDSFAENKPLDRFARELLTAEGPANEVGPVNFYRVAGKPGDMASSLSQVLLGVRIACAECHHHPFDRWSQNDYYGMVSFFMPVKLQGEMLVDGDGGTATNPRTSEKVFAHALGQDS